jgi:hypothetical protein
VNLANKSRLHPLDWKRFYQFVQFCDAQDVEISETDLEWLLTRAGFAQEGARELATAYRGCINEILRFAVITAQA